MTDQEETTFLNDTLIGSLAKDLANGIKEEDVNDITNPKEIIDSLLTGNIDLQDENTMNSGLGHIIKTVCNNLDNKIKDNNIDQNALFREAQQLLGGLNLGNLGGS